MSNRDGLARVSIIIPTYNRSQLLRLTVESVLAQTYSNVEIIVVDDGSTDDTEAVMAEYAGRVTYVKQAHQGGGGRNKGFQFACGDYINFLDHDDLILPTKIERQVQILDTHPNIGLVHCGYYHIDADGNYLDKVGFLPEGEVLKELVGGDFIWSGAPLIRRQCLEQVGLFDNQFCSDWDMWLRIAQAGYLFACVREPLGAYRILPGSEMSNVTKLGKSVFEVLDKVFADSKLPADVLAVKEQSYGAIQLWLSWRYYGAGLWDEAQYNLTEALTRLPYLLEQPEELLESLCNDALSVRIKDPVQFVSDVFNHLPVRAAGFSQHGGHVLARVYLGLALRNYALGYLDEAKTKIEEAISLYPALLEHTDEFAELLRRYAVKLPTDVPGLYVKTVLQNLPPKAQPLGRIQSHVLGDVNIANAFENYYAERYHLVIPQILTALRQRPSHLTNKGVVSIFLRSLPVLLSRKRVAV